MAICGFVCYSAKSAARVLCETSNPAMIDCYLKIPLKAPNQCNVSKSNHCYIHVLEQLDALATKVMREKQVL